MHMTVLEIIISTMIVVFATYAVLFLALMLIFLIKKRKQPKLSKAELDKKIQQNNSNKLAETKLIENTKEENGRND